MTQPEGEPQQIFFFDDIDPNNFGRPDLPIARSVSGSFNRNGSIPDVYVLPGGQMAHKVIAHMGELITRPGMSLDQ